MQIETLKKRLPTPARVSNAYWERRLGIRTNGWFWMDREDSAPYGTQTYASNRQILDALRLRPDDVFVDIGSGKGRVVCMAACSQVGEVIGVEYSEPLTAIARDNAERLRGRRAPIELHTGLAEEFDYSRATVLFLFNPFGPDTL